MNNIGLMKARAKTPTYSDSEGKWVEKQLVDFNDKSEVMDGAIWLGTQYVRANSVCRFTGLKDANGTEIYENDRLKPADYIAPELMGDEELERAVNPANCFSNPVVRWNPYLSAFQLISEYIFQTPPKTIDNGRYIQSDYEVDHVRKVRFQALTPELAQQFVVYGNTIDNPDDSDYRVLPPKNADDFSDFYEEENIDDVKDDDLFEDGKD